MSAASICCVEYSFASFVWLPIGKHRLERRQQGCTNVLTLSCAGPHLDQLPLKWSSINVPHRESIIDHLFQSQLVQGFTAVALSFPSVVVALPMRTKKKLRKWPFFFCPFKVQEEWHALCPALPCAVDQHWTGLQQLEGCLLTDSGAVNSPMIHATGRASSMMHGPCTCSIPCAANANSECRHTNKRNVVESSNIKNCLCAACCSQSEHSEQLA